MRELTYRKPERLAAVVRELLAVEIAEDVSRGAASSGGQHTPFEVHSAVQGEVRTVQ